MNKIKVKRNSPIEYTSWKICIPVAIVFFLITFAIDKSHIVRHILLSILVLIVVRIFDWNRFNEENLSE